MSVDERQVTDALTRYADGVTMTSADVDRMEADLHQKLGRPRRPDRRLVLAAAAILVLVAAVAGGAWWLRRPAPIPAAPTLGMAVPSVTLLEQGVQHSLVTLSGDGSISGYGTARALIHPLLPDQPARWQVDGSTFVVDFTDAQGQVCRSTTSWTALKVGQAAFSEERLTGPACQGDPAPAAVMTQLSPVSPAGSDLAPLSGEAGFPVNDPVQINGVWLLQGTGLLLASDESVGAGADYLLDDDGDLVRSPDAKGHLEATGGRVTLTGAACGDTVLGSVVTHGSGFSMSLNATVVTDPCGYFGGRTTLVWVAVL